MNQSRAQRVRNLAVVAHVDHGKTTLVDALLTHSRLSAGPDPSALDPEREKAVRRMPKYVSLQWRDHLINLLDTPGQADPGGAARRVTRIVEGFLFVVDAREGPAPQSRHMLRSALRGGLKPLVVVNKIDLPDARPREVLEEVREEFRDLEGNPEQLSFPCFFVNARAARCRLQPEGEEDSLSVLLESILGTVPPPRVDAPEGLGALVADLDYDDFLGRLAVVRVFGGVLERGQEVVRRAVDEAPVTARIPGLYGLDGLVRVEVEAAGAGEIVQVSGLESVRIGETLADPALPVALEPLPPQEPVVSVLVMANDSPLAGLEGRYVSAEKLRERLWGELLTNPTIRVEEADEVSALFRVRARSELQIAILIEMMRREGFEMGVTGPRVEVRQRHGSPQEPFERLLIDCPDVFAAVVGQKAASRRAHQVRMVNHGTGRVRLEFRIPARGLVGFRSELLSDTRGSGMINHEFDGWADWGGEITARTTGSLIADRPGRATSWAIEHFQQRGAIFIAPGDEVYTGMIVGEHALAQDLEVNVTKEGSTTAEGGRRESAPLIPTHPPSLERALEFVRDDELVEVTPRALRLRKRSLTRGVARA